jgi:Tol biopolymer transport system component
VRLGTLGSTVAHTLTAAQSRGIFLPPRLVLFVLGKSLMAQEIDLDRPGLVGEPLPLGFELQGSIGISGFRFLSAAEQGTVAYRQVLGDASHIVWVDRQGRELSTAVDDGGWHHLPRLSPDGRRIAVAHYAPGVGHGDIHVHDAERQLDTRVTFDENDDQAAVWSPDGRTLAVTTTSPAASDVYLVDPARPGERRLRRRGEGTTIAEDWFPNGGLLLAINDQDGRSDLYRLPPGEGADLVSVVVAPFSEYSPSLAPDGRWLAYVGDSTGRDEVYVRALDNGEEWRVSKDGGTAPLWRRDGRELFYLDPRGFIVAVPITIGTSFSMGTPVPLFAGLLDDATGRQYDATPDGRRFILNRRKETAERPIVVMIGLPDTI